MIKGVKTTMGMYDEWTPAPKPSHNRRTPKKKTRGEFDKKTIDAILERDGHKCVKCHRSNMIESVPHHIIFKSQNGKGEKRNGVTICRYCHDWAHGKRPGPHGELTSEGREWFEMWRDHNLDEHGDMKRGDG
jgi:5-methylcytosine-specific restriction endonuclease McrA